MPRCSRPRASPRERLSRPRPPRPPPPERTHAAPAHAEPPALGRGGGRDRRGCSRGGRGWLRIPRSASGRFLHPTGVVRSGRRGGGAAALCCAAVGTRSIRDGFAGGCAWPARRDSVAGRAVSPGASIWSDGAFRAAAGRATSARRGGASRASAARRASTAGRCRHRCRAAPAARQSAPSRQDYEAAVAAALSAITCGVVLPVAGELRCFLDGCRPPGRNGGCGGGHRRPRHPRFGEAAMGRTVRWPLLRGALEGARHRAERGRAAGHAQQPRSLARRARCCASGCRRPLGPRTSTSRSS